MKYKKTSQEPEHAAQIERAVLCAYVICTLFLLGAMLLQGRGREMVWLVVGIPVCVYLHLADVRTWLFRAWFVTCVIWGNLLLCGWYTDDFAGMLTAVAAAMILLSLYCLPDLYKAITLFYTVMILTRLLFRHDLDFTSGRNGLRLLLRIFIVYGIEAIAFYLVKTQQDSNIRLRANIASLESAEHSKDDFLANVSHEIRTPVNTVCGMSEILLQQDLPEETRDAVLDVQTAGHNLLSIVTDILDFSELQSGNISFVQEPYSITSVVNDVINIANAKNSEKHLELIVDCDPQMPELMVGDRQKIARILLNVMDNAVKFTEAGGIVLSVRTRREAYGANLCVTVEDTGIGIPPEKLERIFTSFNQVDTGRSRVDGGIGLGLAISQAMTDQMGGFLSMKSVHGEGTQVSIVLPQKVASDAPCIAVQNPERLKVLVYLRYEDNKYPLLRGGYRACLEHMAQGLEVSFCFCRNLPELKRRLEQKTATHLFLGWNEYQEDPAYFEQTADQVETALILKQGQNRKPSGTELLCVFAPFYSLALASVLNGDASREGTESLHRRRFTAPQAHILAVDDNQMNLRVIEGLLKPWKVKISTALSGREALEKVESRAFDLIFMDHMMPGMDGVETFRRIREKAGAYYQQVPVIALTANAVGNAREMFLSEGFDDYVSKPVEISALENVLRKFVPEEKLVYEEAGEETQAPEKTALSGSGENHEPAGTALPDSGEAHEAAEAAPPNPGDDFVLRLTGEGIDARRGMEYCGGSLEDYVEIAAMYFESGEKNIREIDRCLHEEDWKNFVILVHTVKSTSGSIGAGKLSALAAELEARGRSGEVSGIGTDVEEMLSEYRRVLGVLGEESAVRESAADEEDDDFASMMEWEND